MKIAIAMGLTTGCWMFLHAVGDGDWLDALVAGIVAGAMVFALVLVWTWALS